MQKHFSELKDMSPFLRYGGQCLPFKNTQHIGTKLIKYFLPHDISLKPDTVFLLMYFIYVLFRSRPFILGRFTLNLALLSTVNL